jgi:hypothetical protein
MIKRVLKFKISIIILINLITINKTELQNKKTVRKVE